MEQKKLMTPREKLVELIEDSINEWDFYLHHFDDERLYDDVSEEKKKSFEEFISDYLLENGVIVPPCKVGDKFYYLGQIAVNGELKNNFKVFEEVVDSIEEFGTDLIIYDRRGISFGADCIFRTKEEAEKALAEKRADND